MSSRTALSSAALALACLASPAATAPHRAPARPLRAHAQDLVRRIDVNTLNMFVTNVGTLANDGDDIAGAGGEGCFFPKGTSRNLFYAAGLWLGGLVDGVPRVTVAEYSPEYGPGQIVGGAPDNAQRPEYVVYKVMRWTGNPTDSAHVTRTPAQLSADPALDPLAHYSWSEYMAGAVPHGAPWRLYRLPNTSTPQLGDSLDVPGPDVSGDQMLWCVFNDADAARHTNVVGSTAPLGVEVRQTVFGFDAGWPFANTVYLRYDILARGTSTVSGLRAALWSDPDVGSFTDDLAGSSPAQSLGYAYNVNLPDAIYGEATPAVGIQALGMRHSGAAAQNDVLGAFSMYVNGTDPGNAAQAYDRLSGLGPDGTPVIDPVTGLPTTFMVSGDPVRGSGWVDRVPADRRMTCATLPTTLAPGDTLTLWFAIVVGQADTPIGSVAQLQCMPALVAAEYAAGFPTSPGSVLPCLGPTNCPRPLDFWATQCAIGGSLPTQQLAAIAHAADSVSAVFAFNDPLGYSQYCTAMRGSGGTARDSAKREYLALLSNVVSGPLGIAPPFDPGIQLLPATIVQCAALAPGDLSDLLAPDLTPDVKDVLGASYIDSSGAGPPGLAGVPAGLQGFAGGAGSALAFLGGGLDPAAAPDSFDTVTLRFSALRTQKAYRYLRLETADGSAPSVGRAYRYAGMVDVPVTAWDARTGAELDLAFAERALTDANGTLLAAALQPATFDSTWSPDTTSTGGREYLFVIARPYSATPRAAQAVDGYPVSASAAALYALWSRRPGGGAVIDDGDGLEFDFGPVPHASAEHLFRNLEPQPLTDPSVTRQYRELAAAFHDVNHGIGIGPVCTAALAVDASLMDASAEPGRATLHWYLGLPASSARLERRTAETDWRDVGPASVQGAVVTAIDSSVSAGTRYAYRLALSTPQGVVRTEASWLAVPAHATFAIARVWPNPAPGGQPRLSFSLAAPGSVRIEVLDAAGRLVHARDVQGLAAGAHVLDPGLPASAAPGLYFVRVRAGGEVRSSRFVVLR